MLQVSSFSVPIKFKGKAQAELGNYNNSDKIIHEASNWIENIKRIAGDELSECVDFSKYNSR